jgi:hypothetical protein
LIFFALLSPWALKGKHLAKEGVKKGVWRFIAPFFALR